MHQVCCDLLDTLPLLVLTLCLGVAGCDPGVVHTPVHQAPELVAQPGAVAVVQTGHLRPLLLQRVPQAGGEDQPGGETEEPGHTSHLPAAAPATLQWELSSPSERILTSSFVF